MNLIPLLLPLILTLTHTPYLHSQPQPQPPSEAPSPYAPLSRLPDLSPHLTPQEVSPLFDKWKQLVQDVTSKWTPQHLASLQISRQALAPTLTQVTSLTLYSLYPQRTADITPPILAKDYAQLPAFHHYPILGQLTIDHPTEANHWVDFLRDQILSGGEYGMSACEFSPRHGFRLTTATGHVDLLMCYTCGDLLLTSDRNLYKQHQPYLSPITETLINQLFDKLNIPRNKPEREQANQQAQD